MIRRERAYREDRSQPFKWLLAAIIFMLVLGFTVDDVYGGGKNRYRSTTHDLYDRNSSEYNYSGNPSGPDDNDGAGGGGDNGGNEDEPENPESIPEPGTLILIGGGLGAAWIARKLRK